MDISATIAKLKQEPGFIQKVGMVLVHNGIVRGWSRADASVVAEIDVHPDYGRMEQLRAEYEKKPGIFRVLVEAREGRLKPGDDLLFIIVAGDLRENVKPVLAELLDRLKSEAIAKTEFAP